MTTPSSSTKTKIKTLIDCYKERMSGGNPNQLIQFGAELNKNIISDYLKTAVINDISPDIVLCALLESVNDESQSSLNTSILKYGIQNVLHWRFRSNTTATNYINVLRREIPKVAGIRTCINIIQQVFKYGISIKDDEPNRNNITESLMSLIPPAFKKVWDYPSDVTIHNETKPARDHLNEVIHTIFESAIPSFAIPSFIDAFAELPFDEEYLLQFIDCVFANAKILDSPIVAEHLFPALKRNPKQVHECLRKFLEFGLKLDDDNSDEARQAECGLISSLFNASLVIHSESKPIVLTSLSKIISKRELSRSFSPFIISLSFFFSKIAPKIKETITKIFMEKLQDEDKRNRSRLLKHLWNIQKFESFNIEVIMVETVRLSSVNLESNLQHIVDFAFSLIDNAKLDNQYIEANSGFISPSLRQVKIGVRLLQECLKTMSWSGELIYRDIEQRLISHAPNSTYLVNCIDSADVFLHLIENIQYLDLNATELIMKNAVKQFSGNIVYLDKALLYSQKAFINRSDASKRNGLVSLFYLTQPRIKSTFTQCVVASSEDFFETRMGTGTDIGMQHDIFHTMRRAMTQSDIVQADIFMLVPYLLRQNKDLSDAICTALEDRVESATKDEGFPLILNPPTPHFLNCLSLCLEVFPEWTTLGDKMTEIINAVAQLDMDYVTDQMEIFSKPDARETLIAILKVLFNHCVKNQQMHEAMDLFNLYDRIIHKRDNVDKVRKSDDLKSNLEFPSFMTIDLLEQIFDLINDDDNFRTNYGLQNYALAATISMINELPKLRLEQRQYRFKTVLKLGYLLQNAIDYKWVEAPAGTKATHTLPEKLSSAFLKLFQFVFETYNEKLIQRFLRESSLISPDQKIDDVHKSLLSCIKRSIRTKQSAAAWHYCQIAKDTALYSSFDLRFFATIQKLLAKEISSNSPFAGKLLDLARNYAPSVDLQWLIDTNKLIVQNISESDDQISSVVQAMVTLLGDYLDDTAWAIQVWIPIINGANADQAPEFGAKVTTIMLNIEMIIDTFISLDLVKDNVSYYEGILRFLCNFYREIHSLLKQVIAMPAVMSETINNLIVQVTSVLDGKVSKFTIRESSTRGGRSDKRLVKIDTLYSPKLIAAMETVRSDVLKMVTKKLLDDDVKESFARIAGTSVSITKSSKKKKQETIDDDESAGNERSREERTEDESEGAEEPDSVVEDE